MSAMTLGSYEIRFPITKSWKQRDTEGTYSPLPKFLGSMIVILTRSPYKAIAYKYFPIRS